MDYSIDPDFDLRNFGDVPAPFETKRVNEGRSLALTVREGTPSTEANIKLVRETLWDRFRGFRNNETGTFDNAGAEKWLGENAGAIRWLSEATGRDTGFENLVNAEQIVRSISSASAGNIDEAVLNINAAGGFRDGFTEEGFRRLIADADRRSSNLKVVKLKGWVTIVVTIPSVFGIQRSSQHCRTRQRRKDGTSTGCWGKFSDPKHPKCSGKLPREPSINLILTRAPEQSPFDRTSCQTSGPVTLAA